MRNPYAILILATLSVALLPSCSTRLDFALRNIGDTEIRNAEMTTEGKTIRQGTLIPGATKYYGVNDISIPDHVDVSWNLEGQPTIRKTVPVDKHKARKTNEILFLLDGKSIHEG